MIAVDTNVLARAVFDDDPDQSPRARAALESAAAGGGVFVPRTVFVELAWLLRARKRSRSDIDRVMSGLLETEGFSFAEAPLLASALAVFRQTRLGLEDCLIVAESAAAGAVGVPTFDEAFVRSDPRARRPQRGCASALLRVTMPVARPAAIGPDAPYTSTSLSLRASMPLSVSSSRVPASTARSAVHIA